MTAVLPFLMFEGRAEEAMGYYISVFADGEVLEINRFMADDDRPVPFERMIFLGDGDTDVPTMKMMHTKGGFSIAVYDPRNSERDQQKIYGLISEDRVNFVAAADYREGSALDLIVKGLIGRIAINAGTMPEGV